MQITPDYNPTAALKGVGLLIMNQQTVVQTKSIVVCPGPGIKSHILTMKASANITGAIQWETADDPAYTGVWAPFGGGPIDLSTIGAAGELELQFSETPITAIRGRITTVVAGGNLSLIYTGN